MSTTDTSGFGKFIPGFDFLKGLTQSAGGMANMPNMASWIAPTLSVEELDKRIEELKHVHFWLEQNARALAATVQALEVQKMTMATLEGMNFNLADVASALTPRSAAAASPSEPPAAAKAAAEPPPRRRATGKKASAAKTAGAPGMVDPLQLWGALTQQFQHIAANAVKDVAAAATHKSASPPAPKAGAARASAPKAATTGARRPAPRKRAAS